MENKETLHIIKIGGETLGDTNALKSVLEAFSQIIGPKIIVHGGGRKVGELASELGIKQEVVKGRRITSEETLELCVMVYAGLYSKQIVALLQKYQCKALGLSGADLGVITAKKRKVSTIDYKEVGDVKVVDGHLLSKLLTMGITPVFSSITLGENFELLNTNADTLASEIAQSLSQKYNVSLVYCFGYPGVLKNSRDQNEYFKELSKEDIEKLEADKVISDGMIPKLLTALNAKKAGVGKVVILGSENFREFLENEPTGTMIY